MSRRGAQLDRHTAEVLEFHRVLDLLAEGARTPQGADRCRSLRTRRSAREARQALDELDALVELEPVLGLPPSSGMHRIEGDLETARTQGTCLEIETFLAVRETLESCRKVHDYLEDAAAEDSPLGRYLLNMRPQHELVDRFERTFGPRGEILDGASEALRELRGRSRQIRGRILRTLESVLRDRDLEPTVQDDFITLRGNRFVVPLRTDFSGYLDGIVHDRSRSGATFFVEPLEVVGLNNELGVVREEEEREIHRLLTALTAELGREAPALLDNMAVVAHVDLLAACWRLARRLDARRPEVAEEPVLHVVGARHPLLAVQEEVEVVPVDLRVGETRRLLVVTGANAGGKTVALKTAGLTALMAHCGLYISAGPGSVVGWFDGVYADIGDEQNIDRHLSTFSAHVGHLVDILARAEDRCLVLLDELGTGTDPAEGVGLAMAILEELLERGSVTMATTHLAGLKAFAYSREEAQNASVAFDPESGRPLYQLIYGHAGASNALDVAERLGLPAPVVARARQFATGEGEAVGALLRELEEARGAAERAAKEADVLREQWRERVRQQETLVATARRERDAARSEARQDAERLLREAREQLAETIQRFARREIGQQEAESTLHAARGEIEEALRSEAEEEPEGEALRRAAPGDVVFVPSLKQQGTVEEVDEDGRKVTVRVGNLRLAVTVDELRASNRGLEGAETPRAPRIHVQAEHGSAEVVVVGCSIDEAVRRVDKALNRALLSGADGFRVVHGRGTGALRRGLREYLSEEPQVGALQPEQGDAATWVEIR